MAEALGLAASVIAVLQITNSVISLSHDYSAAANNAPWELPQIITELGCLRNILQILEPLAKQAEHAGSSAQTRLPTLATQCTPGGLLVNLLGQMEQL